MNTGILPYLEFIQTTCSSQDREMFFSLKSCVLSLWSVFSTPVENVRQIRLFMQNKPNFSPFFTQKRRFHKKTKPIQSQTKPILAQKSMCDWKTKPNKPNSNPNKLESSLFAPLYRMQKHSKGVILTGLDINLPNSYISFSKNFSNV